MNKNKNKEISVLKFKPLTDKKEKQEIIQWLNNNCSLFSGVSLPSDIKLNISEVEKERKRLYGSMVLKSAAKFKDKNFCWFRTVDPFFGDFQNQGIDLYIIKEGNAFSRIKYSSKINFYKEGKFSTVIPKGAKDLKGGGIISEIFCEGEPIIKDMDIWPAISLYKITTDRSKLEHQIIGELIIGSPFGEHIYPTQIINIPREEIKKAFSKSDLFWSRLFQVIVQKSFIDKWRLWFQLSNKADIKLLSVLYLYFIGKLPLHLWRIEGTTVDNGTLCFKKPNLPIDEFEVSIKELTLFSGLTRKCVRELLLGGIRKKRKEDKVKTMNKKSIFEQNERLAKLLKCENASRKEGHYNSEKEGHYNFSTPSLMYLLHWIEFGCRLFLTTQKFE